MTETRRKVIEIVTAVYDRASQIDEAADEIIDLIKSAERGEWRPIGAAPKDGTVVLVCPPTWSDRTCSMAKFDRDEYAVRPRPFWERGDARTVRDSRGNPPTHWAPLPAPPENE